MSISIRITRVHPDARIPAYATPGSIGFDIPLVEDLVVPARGSIKARTGLIIATPPGYGLFLFPRSSTFGKTGLQLANTVGVLDQDFCGPEDEIRLHFWNPGEQEVHVPKGTRLVQGVFIPILQAQWSEGEPRGTSRGGFGSTG